ncbi:PD-(D/E)XK nuclease family protein [Nocardioides sp. Y6]|uniref:PD-(D/E)XK nuclease family protein n=1 Tax=Nocardioides malaquae TaxID=2773426 RepID=A0ABR9RWT0_9ACTN|nr:PD-(D/E)XK nuclease family protein [Nocardioides malaquae]MBE7326031.1 PD-(D/E)XK nuclease family protein [Nocardioides malaquae]
MNERLVTMLLPALSGSSAPAFNVFDVMHHGTHEKQLSNVFAWLLDRDGSHGLGSHFQDILVDAVNRHRASGTEIASGSFSVRQEVNVSGPDEPMDIADLVLEDDDTRLVIENYYTSDGHGHSYKRYLNYATLSGKQGVVVMLCARVNSAFLSGGWEKAAVVSYPDLIAPLTELIEGDARYRRTHPDQVAFLRHLHHRFVKDRTVNDHDMIQFIDAMCSSGQAKHYRTQSVEAAAVNFADSLRDRAHDQFGESRALLQRVKAALKNHASRHLVPQLAQVLGPDRVTEASANYAGIYQWTVNFAVAGREGDGEAPLQLKFGPSAWWANESDQSWQKVVTDPDYSRLFLTHRSTQEIRQSAVTLQEVLDGLAADDHRLRDELVNLLNGVD